MMAVVRSGIGENFSDYVIFNGVVYLRGVTARDQTKTISEQTTDCLGQIDEFLSKAGTDKSQLLTSTVYISDMANKAGMNAAWRNWIDPSNRPTRATVQAPLATSKTLVEIVVSAVVK